MKVKNSLIKLLATVMLLSLIPIQQAFSQSIYGESARITVNHNDNSSNHDSEVAVAVKELQELHDSREEEILEFDIYSGTQLKVLIDTLPNNARAIMTLTQDIETPSTAIVVRNGKHITIRSDQEEHWAMTKSAGEGFHLGVLGATLVVENVILQSRVSVSDDSPPIRHRGGISSGQVATDGLVEVVPDGMVIIDGAIIRNNVSHGHESALHLSHNTTFIMYSGQIYNNFNLYGASENFDFGGGMMSLFNSTATFYGGEIHSNSTGNQHGVAGYLSFGGAVHLSRATVNIYGGRFHNNTAVYGGAFSVTRGSELNIMGGEIFGNTAAYGGAISVHYIASNNYYYENYLTIHDEVVITDNHSKIDGGAIYNGIALIDTINISSGAYFARNTAGNGAYQPPETRPTNINSATTSIFDHLLNNFDINFTEGDVLTLEDATRITIDAQENREITINRMIDINYSIIRDSASFRINFPRNSNVHLDAPIIVNLPNAEWNYQIESSGAEQMTVTIQSPYDDGANGDNGDGANGDNGASNNNDINDSDNNNNVSNQLVQTGMNTVAVTLLFGLAMSGIGVTISLKKKK